MSTNRNRWFIPVLMSALCVFVAGYSVQAHASKRDKPKVMLILDGSGSMWGQIDGKHKIEIARETVNGLLDEWNPELDIGLMSYGHRSKSDCSDIEELIEPGPNNIGSIRRAVKRINPRGKTPLSQSVINAAESMGFEDSPAAVILVSDGKETCGLDPCEVGRELRRRGLDFTAHVIGFSLNAKQKENLECLADNTGGGFINAGNADELLAALLEAAAKVARQGDDRVAGLLAEGGEPIGNYSINWKVAKPSEPSKTLLRQNSPVLTLKGLEPGDYLVTADTGAGSRRATISISPEEVVDHAFPLNMGDMQTQALVDSSRDGRRIKWEYRDDSGRLLNQQIGATSRLIGNAGKYSIEAALGAVRIKQTTSVAAGEVRKLDFDFRAGGVRLTARQAAGGELASVIWSVKALGDTKLSAGLLKAQKGSNASYKLRAGSYRITATHPSAVITRDIQVPPAEWVTEEFSLALGSIVAEAMQTDASTDGRVSWKVYKLDNGDLGELAFTASASSFESNFGAGSYRIIAEHNYAQLSEDINLAEGERRRVRLFMDGRLKVAARDGKGGVPVYVKWHVYNVDESGKATSQILVSERAEREFVLPAGRYLVVARSNISEAQKIVQVVPGKTSIADIDMNQGYLRVSSYSAEGGDPVWVRWQVSKVGVDGAKQAVHMQQQKPAMELELPAGQYQVTLQHPAGSKTEMVTVESAKLTEQRYSLDISYLNLKVFDREGGQPQLSAWVLDQIDSDGKAIGRVQSGRGAVSDLVLPAGQYRLTVADNDAPTQAVFNLAPGEQRSQTIVLGLGTVLVQGADADGLNLEPYEWRVVRRLADGGESAITEFEAASRIINLQQGQYRIEAARDGWKQSRLVSVAAGKTVTEKVSLFGRVNLSATDRVKGELVDAEWRISRRNTDNLGDWVKTSQGIELKNYSLELPAGEYEIEATHAVASAQIPVTVKAGATAELEVALNIAELSLEAVRPNSDGTEWLPATWKVVSAAEADQGRVVLAGNGERLSETLPAGRYQVIANYDFATVSRTIDLVPGKLQSETLLFPLATVTLSATDIVGGLATDAEWLVQRIENGEVSADPVAVVSGVSPSISVLQGEYQVTAKSGDASYSQPIELKAGDEKAVQLSLRGAVSLQAASPAGADEAFVDWRVHDQSPVGEKGPLREVKRGQQVRFDLPAGRYWVEASADYGQQGKWLTVENGKIHNESYSLFGRLQLRAANKRDGDSLYAHWAIYQKTDQGRKQVMDTTAASIGIDLAPGAYVVESEYDGHLRVAEYEVTAGEFLREQVVFDLGALSLTARYVEGGEPVVVQWKVSRLGADDRVVERRDLETAATVLELPAGNYAVTATHSGQQHNSRVSIGAAETADVAVVLNLGELEVVASATPDGDPVYVNWSVYRLNANGGVEEWVANGDKASRRFTLPAGSYRVVAVHDDVQLKQEITVEAGKLVQGKFTLSGIFSAVATDKADGDPIYVEWRVFRRGKDGVLGAMVANAVAAERDFILPAGQYRVVAHHEAQEKTIDIELKAGAALVRKAVMNVGRVQLQAVANEGGAALVVRWELRKLDPVSGETSVAYERIGETANATLAAGDYVLWAKHDQGVVTRKLTVIAGEELQQTVDFKLGLLQLEATRKTGLLSSDLINANWIALPVDEHGVATSAPLLLGMHRKHTVPLAAGKYQLMAQHEGRSYRQNVVIEAGSTESVSVNIDEE